jgi:hypothetical protein
MTLRPFGGAVPVPPRSPRFCVTAAANQSTFGSVFVKHTRAFMQIKDVDAETVFGLLMIRTFLAIECPARKQRVIDFARSVLDEEKPSGNRPTGNRCSD